MTTEEISISIHESGERENEQRPEQGIHYETLFPLLFISFLLLSSRSASQNYFSASSALASLFNCCCLADSEVISLISHALENEDSRGKCVSTRMSSEAPPSRLESLLSALSEESGMSRIERLESK
jgi:hypothetical protein